MKKFFIHNALAIVVFSATACIMLVVPVTSTLHIDSAMVAALSAAVTAAWVAAGQSRSSQTRADARSILVLALLLGFMALPLAAIDQLRSCATLTGLGFWLWIPPVSLLFGYSVGRFMRLCSLPAPRLLAVSTIVLLTVFAWLPLLFSPRLFFFHPVIGYWPGALYDEVPVFPDALPWHRAMTLAWAAVVWSVGDLVYALSQTRSNHQTQNPSTRSGFEFQSSGESIPAKNPSTRSGLVWSISVMVAALFFLAATYLNSAELNIHAGRHHLQQRLGGVYQAGPVTLYYSQDHFSADEIRHIAALHLFHLEEIADTLQVDLAQMNTIESYLYGNEWQMQTLTGAKNVSYVPVWQATPQLHMRRQAIDATLRHELVHVVAREFGNRVLRASWSIGLVEGLAVALAPAHAGLTVDQQVKANEAFYSAEELRRLFSLTGFYRVSARVAYPVSGSFVAVLLQEYPVSLFREAYRTSSLQGAYGNKLPEAVRLWHDKVEQTPVTEPQRQVARAAFATPGLFDKPCPRVPGGFATERDRFRASMEQGDTVQALAYLARAISLEPGWQIGWQHYIRLTLARKGADAAPTIIRRESELPDAVFLHILLADARFMLEQQSVGTVSDGWVSEVLAPFSDVDDHAVQRALLVRSNARRWAAYLGVVHADAHRFKALAEQLPSLDDNILMQVYAAEYIRRRHNIGGMTHGDTPLQPEGEARFWQYLTEEPLHPYFCELTRPAVLQAAAYVPVSELEWWGRASLCEQKPAHESVAFVSARRLGLDEAMRFATYVQQSSE